MFKENFAKRIKEIRKSRKLTQEHLAELVGVDFRYISLIENAKSFPSCDLIEKLSKALDVSYKEIFDFDSDYSREELEKNFLHSINMMNDKNLKILYKFTQHLLYN